MSRATAKALLLARAWQAAAEGKHLLAAVLRADAEAL